MTRWSLRSLKLRATQAATLAEQSDPGRARSFPPTAAQAPSYQSGPPTPVSTPVVPAFSSSAGQPHGLSPVAAPAPAAPAPVEDDEAWPEIMEQFGLHLISLAEQMRMSLDDLESDEADPERLRKLYEVDHAVTRMRRASRDLRTLAGRAEDEMGGTDTSLLDIIRMALSGIERYNQVIIGRVSDLAVIGYAADDVASLIAALLDNATKYSPGSVAVNVHLADAGSVLFRIEDSGIGIPERSVSRLNALLAGPVVELVSKSGSHTGFPVVHRLARKYDIDVRLATRPSPGNGMIAMVTVPAQLLCELPVAPLERAAQPRPASTTSTVSELPSGPRRAGPRPVRELPAQSAHQSAHQSARHSSGPSSLTPSQPMPAQPMRPLRSALPTLPARTAPEPGSSEAQVAPQPIRRTSPDNSTDTMKTAIPLPGENGGSGEMNDTSTPAGQSGPVESGALPRREPNSLRGEQSLREAAAGPEAPDSSPEERSAARRSFADDLDAFSI